MQKNMSLDVTKNTFSIEKSIKQAWYIFKENWKDIYKVGFISLIIQLIAQYLTTYNSENMSPLVAMIGGIAYYILTSVLTMNNVRILLKIIRAQDFELEELFNFDVKVFSYLWGSFVIGMLVFVGMILLVIPGLYWAFKYMFTPYIIIDQGLGYREAMKKSGRMTEGYKLKMFLFGLALLGINLLGMLPLFLGLLITIPLSYVAYLVVYEKLSFIESEGQTQDQVNHGPQQPQYVQ